MTLVTTSRRSTTESRALARDLAFAIEARYLARGKRGIRDLVEIDTFFFIISQEEKDLMLRWYHDGELALERKIIKISSLSREGIITRGIVTSDPDVYHRLSRIYPVIQEEEDDLFLRVDGPQRRQTTIKLRKPEPTGNE